MQVESVRFFVSVEGITKDWGMKSLLVGTMHPKLVGSSCQRSKTDPDFTTFFLQYLIFSDSLLAMKEIDDLSRTVKIVW